MFTFLRGLAVVLRDSWSTSLIGRLEYLPHTLRRHRTRVGVRLPRHLYGRLRHVGLLETEFGEGTRRTQASGQIPQGS
jgi:hypothetical protein